MTTGIKLSIYSSSLDCITLTSQQSHLLIKHMATVERKAGGQSVSSNRTRLTMRLKGLALTEQTAETETKFILFSSFSIFVLIFHSHPICHLSDQTSSFKDLWWDRGGGWAEVGTGAVPHPELDHLLLLCLERNQVNRKGMTLQRSTLFFLHISVCVCVCLLWQKQASWVLVNFFDVYWTAVSVWHLISYNFCFLWSVKYMKHLFFSHTGSVLHSHLPLCHAVYSADTRRDPPRSSGWDHLLSLPWYLSPLRSPGKDI